MLKIEQQILPYTEGLESRRSEDVDLIVIHATETPDLGSARHFAEVIHYPGSGTGNSGHFYVDLDGQVYQYVPIERVAHHVSGHNKNSIGIELVNLGRYPHWFHSQHQEWRAEYPAAQLNGLLRLVTWLHQEYPAIRAMARHSDLDRRLIPAEDAPEQMIQRKLDPGVTFPWQWLLRESGLSAQTDQSDG